MRIMTMNMGTTKALRAASGNLAARRGSTLILVVATLALLAVLTVAYVSIGGGDRRTARTTTRAAEVKRQAKHIGDYLVGIVGDDALSVYFEGFDPAGEPIFVTEAVDLPRTDFNRTFDGTTIGGTPDPQTNYYGLAFTPTGSLPPLRAGDSPTQAASNLFTSGGDLRPFGPSDPFLAASEPTYIRQRGDAFSNPAYLDRKDWSKISNIGPNGLYVNLFNLRGDFDAQPGIGAGQMSDPAAMFLTDRNSNPTRNLAYGGTADPRIPAHFDSVLIGSYQPVNFDNGSVVDEAEYMPYSWADADGDGFFDSRWQELVDVTEPTPGTFVSRKVVPSEGQLRWFVAARIIDLSGRVNVNTARGLLQPDLAGGYDGAPNNGYRLGASPADVDLLRVLTLENTWAMFDEFYDSAVQPAGGAQDYSDYSNFGVSTNVGREGFWALRRVLTGEQPPAGPPIPVPPQLADERRGEYASVRRGGDTPLRSDFDGVYRQYGFGLEDLSELLAFNGLNNPNSLSSLERATGGRDSLSSLEFGPLRDNRSLQWERSLTDPDAAMALRHLGVRQHLTTLSGGIPRVPWRVRYTSASPTALDVFTSISSIPESTVAIDPSSENPVVLQDGYRLLTLGAPTDLPMGTSLGGSGGSPQQADERLKRNAHPLLRTYGNALMPAAGEPGAWSQSAWTSTFYGFDPLFALRTSAHMVANMVDAFDGDDIPSAFTVLVQGDSAGRSIVTANPDVFPWWNEPDPDPMVTTPGVGGQLDFGEERLPTPGETDGVVAMNVYGLEVHPFITQVSLYNIFTDAPAAAGGDMEYVDPGPGGGGGPIFAPGGGGASNPVTIDFDTNPTMNSDFVGQLFAVQLTNPYTTDIVVHDNQFYVRFGELGGPTASPALPDGLEVPAGTRIPAGESMVFYAQTENMGSRAATAAPPFEPVTADQVDTWINLHLTGDPNEPAVEFATFTTGVDDFLGGVAGSVSGDADANREVTLWTRLNRAGGQVSDVLLDRLYDPADLGARPTLDRRPPAVNTDISGTVVGPEDGIAAEAIDNTGFSIVTWGTIARPTGDVEAPQGALPAYILEKPFVEVGVSLNEAATDSLMLPAPPSMGVSLNRGHFLGGGKLAAAERNLADIFSNGTGSTGTMAQIPTDIALQAGDLMVAHQHRQIVTANETTPSVLFSELYVNPFRNDNRGRLETPASTSVRMLRPGDFLGVPAVGPVQMPARFNGGLDPLDLDWFTTGEMLTLALGFDEAPPTGSGLYYPSLPEDTYGLLDRGHLSLNLPAPFVDLVTPSGFSPGDERRGLGVPHAMAITSSITTLDVPINTRTPIAGIVNLNTATETVTSVLPGLTPTFESTLDPAFSDWFRDGANVLHDHRSDVAAGVRSYRDRSAARTRRGTATMPPFYDTGAAWGDSDPTRLASRQIATGIDALREDTGFLSVGEMLAADTLPIGGPIIGPSTYARPHMIRRLGQDQFSLNVDGVDAVRYTATGEVDTFTGVPGFDDGVINDYDEQLALFNGVANTVSVRSDVYAIWFVMHGYAREDVEGLRPDDPMTPSVARRYLMIVDRSNVRRAGDKPKVLLFDELPL